MVRDVIIFSDPGEEIDDELAIWKADQIFGSYISRLKSYLYCSEQFHLHVVVVSGSITAENRRKRCRDLIGVPKAITYWTPETFEADLMLLAFVLVIGPLELGEYAERIISSSFPPELVFLAGSVEGSVNYGRNENAQNNCKKLLSIAKQTVVLESGTLSEQKMTPLLLSQFPETLLVHIAALTWRFLLGRASAPARHVAHLASPSLARAKHRPASNYVAIEAVYREVKFSELAHLEISDKANELVFEYAAVLDGLEEYCEEVGVPHNAVLREYAELMEALLQLGWYTDRVMFSTDSELSDKVLLTNPSQAFLEFQGNIFNNIGSPLPCYDYNALQEFVDYII